MPQKHALRISAAVHIASEEGTGIGELILVDDEGFIAQPMTPAEMRKVAALLQSEAARIEKGQPPTHKHFKMRFED